MIPLTRSIPVLRSLSGLWIYWIMNLISTGPAYPKIPAVTVKHRVFRKMTEKVNKDIKSGNYIKLILIGL